VISFEYIDGVSKRCCIHTRFGVFFAFFTKFCTPSSWSPDLFLLPVVVGGDGIAFWMQSWDVEAATRRSDALFKRSSRKVPVLIV
jgi:hypothetical protein